jgi:hypothetical protein
MLKVEAFFVAGIADPTFDCKSTLSILEIETGRKPQGSFMLYFLSSKGIFVSRNGSGAGQAVFVVEGAQD